ncbi:DKNYY domain-containing protein [Patescibacteria group bacterium]|nr:DKNYY domain-containing protein [Patescibacteria group bacterium]
MSKSILSLSIFVLIITLSACSTPNINKTLETKEKNQEERVIQNSLNGASQDKQINEYYAVRDSKVYYNDLVLEGANPESFMVISGFYSSDGNYIYHKNNIVDGAIVTKFSVLGGTEYATDGSFIYHPQYPEGNIGKIELNTESAESFQIIDRVFGKYMDTIYCGSYKLDGADAKTFESISTYYKKDEKNIYTGQCNKLDKLDVKTAIVIKEEMQDAYIKDSSNVYYFDTAIKGAHPASFITLANGYSKDINFVYYNKIDKESLTLDTDPILFKVLDNGYAQDSNNYYLNGKKINQEEFDLR